MFAELQTVFDRARAMFVKRAGFAGAIWQIVIRFFVRLDRAGFEEKKYFRPARRLSPVVRRNGSSRTRATNSRRKNACALRGRSADATKLHVALAELMRGGAEQLLAQQFRARVNQRHRILQLVAKTERAARLIKSRARPQAQEIVW